MTFAITKPVPQSKVPPGNQPGFSCTIWKDGVRVHQAGGATSELAAEAAAQWVVAQGVKA